MFRASLASLNLGLLVWKWRHFLKVNGLLPKGFGHANYAVPVAAIGECTQLKERYVYECVELTSLPNSD